MPNCSRSRQAIVKKGLTAPASRGHYHYYVDIFAAGQTGTYAYLCLSSRTATVVQPLATNRHQLAGRIKGGLVDVQNHLGCSGHRGGCSGLAQVRVITGGIEHIYGPGAQLQTTMRSKLGMNAPRELQVKRDRVARQEEADAEYNLPTKPPLPGR